MTKQNPDTCLFLPIHQILGFIYLGGEVRRSTWRSKDSRGQTRDPQLQSHIVTWPFVTSLSARPESHHKRATAQTPIHAARTPHSEVVQRVPGSQHHTQPVKRVALRISKVTAALLIETTKHVCNRSCVPGMTSAGMFHTAKPDHIVSVGLS